jgi:uncharacterized protein YjbJ (UPF0337 family)
MNEHSIEGGARDVVGKVKDAAGGMMGDAKTQIDGKLDQAAGMAQSAAGQVADHVKDSPLTALAIAGAVGFVLGRMGRA